MLVKKEFLTIFTTYSALDVIKQTLPTVIAETRNNPNAALIVCDSTDNQHKEEVWRYLRELNQNNDFFLLLTTNASVGDIRNTCMYLGKQLYIPDYICILDNDHGYRESVIPNLIQAMRMYYGKPSPNGLKYGMFTACNTHRNGKRGVTAEGYMYPDAECEPGSLGGTNGCFRCAPTAHWDQVLKGYDSDEYLISIFQTDNLIFRNYMNGFTTLILPDNQCWSLEHPGRGTSDLNGKWDQNCLNKHIEI